MSFLARIEFFLNIQKFTNIDLRVTKKVFLKVKLFQECKNSINYAKICLTSNMNRNGNIFQEEAKIMDENTFETETFYPLSNINYDINKVINFRIEINAYPIIDYEKIYLECDLCQINKNKVF